MTNNHSEKISSSPQTRFAIPVEIRHHPKLDQATKFAWIYIWELADFRPNTIITTVARLAAELGKSERAARRWIQCLAESGLIEMIEPSRRGECVFYVNSSGTWQGASPPPSVHKVFGTSVPDMPNENQDCGTSGTDVPISLKSEEKNKFILEREKREGIALKLLIEKRQAKMPRDPLGISGIGTESANCQQSRVINNSMTVDRRPSESDGNAEPQTPELPPQARGPCSGVVKSIISSSDRITSKNQASRTEQVTDATFQWLREQWPDEEDVYGQLLIRCAQAVAYGHLSKEELHALVAKSKLPRIEHPARHFCATMPHHLPPKKPR